MENKRVNVTVGQVANTAVNLFAEDCINIAKENWSKSQVEMLERLFESIKRGCEYKCVGCTYFGRVPDAQETVEECMWQPGEEDGWNLPCEEE